jgi:APA family basic amino acid/polyamine antiporter
MFSLPTATWLRLIIWMAVGLLIYFTYGIHHSKLRNGKKE